MTEAEKEAAGILAMAKEKLQSFIDNLEELTPAYEDAKEEVISDAELSQYQKTIKLAKLRAEVNKAMAPSSDTLKTISLLASICTTNDQTGSVTFVINGSIPE